MTNFRRRPILFAALLLASCGCGPSESSSRETTLRCGVGPYFPTPGENRTHFDPLFQEMARQVGRNAEVTVADDWIGIAEALRSGTLDVAWLGPWGFVLARLADPSLEAIATVKYRDRPTYHAVLVARADAPFDTLDDAVAQSRRGPRLKLSLADVGSTSGWLIPRAEFQRRSVELKEVFDYSEGASHAAQAVAVLVGQTDVASDYDRNLDVLADARRIDRAKLKVIWQSDPLPNDPIVVRGGLPADIKQKLQAWLVGLSPEEAALRLPKNYTGFVASDGSNYAVIEAAGKSVGRLK